MAKKQKRRAESAEKAYGFYEFIANIIDIIANLMSAKVIGTAALIVGVAAGGGFFGYQFGFDDGFGLGQSSVICEECEICEVCEICPEPIECPEIPECPRPIEDYSCEEINQAKAGECACIPF